ncbi:DUF4112 domain-containing protein [Glacieibacterium sp.]|uniref:DUF4112 domain-containing protein n=1 Tax=Glacieibacterium sp. TaxID=2860237 RepID=UPI003AFF7F28
MTATTRFDTFTGRHPEAVRARLQGLEFVLEKAFRVPGTRMRVGLDSVVGLVPVAGDVITGLMGCYLVWEARNAGASRWLQARMLANVGIDTAIGAIPFVGDAFDFVFKSNSKNMRLLRHHLDRYHPVLA